MTTRRNDDRRLILPAMTTTNPTAAPVHSELGRAARPMCGSAGCPTCPQVHVPIPAPIGEAITAGSIVATNIFTTTIKAPEPELTIKQAAKAYRKAVRAAEKADADATAARAAAKAANDAASKANDAVRDARQVLAEAAAR